MASERLEVVVMGAFGDAGGVAASQAAKHHHVTILQDPEDLHPVTELRRPGPRPYADLIDRFNDKGTITVLWPSISGGVEATVTACDSVTSDYSCVSEADVVLLVLPSLFHEVIGDKLREHIGTKRRKVLIALTDRSFGGYSCYHHMGMPANVIVVGVSVTPSTASKEPGVPFCHRVHVRKQHVTVGVFPEYMQELGMAVLRAVVPGCYVAWGSPLDLALDANASILHAAHELSNIDRILDGHTFALFGPESSISATEQEIRALSEERQRIASAWGVRSRAFLEYEQRTYGEGGRRFRTVTQNRNENPAFAGLRSPSGLRKCKGIEAVVCSLCVWEDMARKVGAESRAISSCIDRWQEASAIELRRYGRTPATLGLAEMTVQRVAEFMRCGA
jgi:hypothetical protein